MVNNHISKYILSLDEHQLCIVADEIDFDVFQKLTPAAKKRLDELDD